MLAVPRSPPLGRLPAIRDNVAIASCNRGENCDLVVQLGRCCKDNGISLSQAPVLPKMVKWATLNKSERAFRPFIPIIEDELGTKEVGEV